MSFSTLWHLGLERSLALTYISWKPRSPFRITEIEGPLLTYDQMSDNDLLSCTNSLVTKMVVINHRNIPWGPRCLQPPQLPSSKACGLRRSHRQALDSLSAINPAKRGAVLLMHWLGEVGAPLLLAALAEQAVEKLFREGPSPRHMDTLQDILPMLKNKSNGSPSVGWSVDWGLRLEPVI